MKFTETLETLTPAELDRLFKNLAEELTTASKSDRSLILAKLTIVQREMG